MRILLGELMMAALLQPLGLRAEETEPQARVAVFQADGFPTVDAPDLAPQALTEALKGLPVDFLSTPETLRERLEAGAAILLLPYGSAFPMEAWEAIRLYLERGGGLVVLGGAPFHQPILRNRDGRWAPGLRQPTFARELLIGPAEEIRTDGWKPPAPVDGTGWTQALPPPARTFALTVRFATRKDQPQEDGSAGPRDAVLRPLIHMADADGMPRACPLQEIDRLRGPGAGGRWVLATSDAIFDARFIRACVDRALAGASNFELKPINAALEPGEFPRFRVSLHRPKAQRTAPARVRATLRDATGRAVLEAEAELTGPDDIRTGELSLKPPAPLSPGRYRVEASLPNDALEAVTGFWIKDERLLKEGPALTISRDWLRLDGRVFPVIGTTYMASDVHRKFLFEPNPELWDRDFALMKRTGVNFVRTGLWTGWNRLMLDPGAIDDTALRALDAFVLTAAKHRIVLCFTFFAFLPPAFGGENPYLDPRALEGQRRLLTLVAHRYKGSPWVHFDLINEPSYSPPDALWSNRPMGDRFERVAWKKWIVAHHGSDPAVLRDLWRDASEGIFDPPRNDELTYAAIKGGKRPRKVRDFRLFTQEVFVHWAAEMRRTLREAGGQVLVTVGQDEAGLNTSPSQQLMAPSLDYVAVHTWWATDDVLWDGAVSKVPEKPLLIQETGMMRLEDLDGFPWRSPEDAARLLERKFAAAFASRGAGAVEWAWNINPYQPIENEAVIGFVRPDGTAKTEIRVLKIFSDFFARAAAHLGDFAADPVVLLYPHSRTFMGRPHGPDASKRAVRILADRFGIVPTVISDLSVDEAHLRMAKLVLVPSPEMLDDAAAKAILTATASGVRVLVTGAISGDGYGRVPESLRSLGIVDPGRPLMFREPTKWAGWATFDSNLGERLRRSLAAELKELKGRIWHEPLPLEFAREDEPLAALLAAALKASGVPIGGSGGPAASRVLATEAASLIVGINESPANVTRRVVAHGRRYEVPIAAGRARMLLVHHTDGRLLAETPGAPVRLE